MSGFYDDMAQTARELVDEFGRTITLRRVNPGAYSAASDSFSGASSVDHTVKAVFTSFKAQEIDGEIIRRDDKRVILAGIAPLVGDQILEETTTWRVLSVETVKPGDTDILWKVQARR